LGGHLKLIRYRHKFIHKLNINVDAKIDLDTQKEILEAKTDVNVGIC
jgi:hypothetical protein